MLLDLLALKCQMHVETALITDTSCHHSEGKKEKKKGQTKQTKILFNSSKKISFVRLLRETMHV